MTLRNTVVSWGTALADHRDYRLLAIAQRWLRLLCLWDAARPDVYNVFCQITCHCLVDYFPE